MNDIDTCDCPCHEPGARVRHFAPCCEPCRGCGRPIKLAAARHHAATCPAMGPIHRAEAEAGRLRAAAGYYQAEARAAHDALRGLKDELDTLARSAGFDPAEMDAMEIVRGIGRRVDDLKAARAELLAALRDAVEVARKTHANWDAERDARVGKYLAAMAGWFRGYDPETDRVHAALARHEGGMTAGGRQTAGRREIPGKLRATC